MKPRYTFSTKGTDGNLYYPKKPGDQTTGWVADWTTDISKAMTWENPEGFDCLMAEYEDTQVVTVFEGCKMSDMKCQHEWEYFDDHDFPNGYEYEQVNIPHKRCKKCGREYELFDGYGEYAKRWRKVEYWSPELHKLEQELIRTRKALDVAVDVLKEIDELLSSNKFDVKEVPLLNITQTKISMLLRCINIEQKESAFVHNKIEFPEYNDGLLEEFDKQFFENGQDDDLTETALEQKD